MLSKVPINVCHSGGKNSMLYTYETLKFPLTSSPSTKSTKQVKVNDLDKISPSEMKIAPVEVAKTTFLRPFRSAYLGIRSEENIQPMKKELPRAPI